MDLTPNKRKRERETGGNKENAVAAFTNIAFMEVKSLADIHQQPRYKENPFEVYRNPQKKFRKRIVEDQCCFANPALNINAPEHVVNPYEIIRSNLLPADDGMCFENNALNVAGDVQQQKQNVQQAPTISRAIAVPFTPTIGCRINFNDIPLESLTPCSMLTNKLTLNTPRAAAAMSMISEESLNIDEELDCYQLQLENSINEAKQGINKRPSSIRKRMHQKSIQNFSQRLNEASNEMNPPNVDGGNSSSTASSTIPASQKSDVKLIANDDVEFYDELSEKEDDDDDDEFVTFKNPAPFVRTFRRKSIKKVSSSDDVKSSGDNETKSSIRSSIRKSIRHLLPSGKNVGSTEKLDGSSNFLSSIRHSLRRKHVVPAEQPNAVHDLSVMIDSERKIFKQFPNNGSKLKNEKADDAKNGKVSLRSSFRNSTKDVRRHVRQMFTKNLDEYELQ